MQHDWHSVHYARLRQKDLQHEAEQHQLAQVAHPSHRGRITRIYGPALYRIGRTMTRWGQHLQTEYGESTRLQNLLE